MKTGTDSDGQSSPRSMPPTFKDKLTGRAIVTGLELVIGGVTYLVAFVIVIGAVLLLWGLG